MGKNIDGFLAEENKIDDAIRKKALFQVINELTPQEKDEFEQELSLLLQDHSMEKLFDAYCQIYSMTMEEAKYFARHGDYRYHTLAEVEGRVYNNKEYMEKYMLGLRLTQYLWLIHLRMSRYFDEILRNREGTDYLEIGVGHGKHFLRAIKYQRFLNYTGVDMSQTSIELTRRNIEWFYPNGCNRERYELICQDVNQMKTGKVYDFIVMSEVIEHVEKPLKLLKTLHDLVSDSGFIYITVPVNSPEIDHIYLFRSYEEIREMINAAELCVVEYKVFTAGNMEIEKAIKRKQPIVYGIMLKKSSDI